MRFLFALLCTWLLVSCGGGGATGTPAPVAQCAPFSDSFGNAVTCSEMNALAGATLPYLDISGGSDGAGDGGADGAAGDGAPIANATLKFTDVNGKEVTTTTNATGYYRISLRGLKAPLVATVVRNDKPWKSMLVNDIVRAPANRAFYTINLTGLTDVVVSEVAKKDGLASTDAITPAAIARQKAQVAGIVTALNTTLSAQITAAGLNPATFNPLTTPFRAIASDSSDKLLESVVVNRDTGSGFTVVAPKYSLGGTVAGLGGVVGLSLTNGTETLSIAANAATFTFGTLVPVGTAYNIVVKTQPTGLLCTVNNGAGTMAAANTSSVVVVCGTADQQAFDAFRLSPNVSYALDWNLSYGSAQQVSGTNYLQATASSFAQSVFLTGGTRLGGVGTWSNLARTLSLPSVEVPTRYLVNGSIFAATTPNRSITSYVGSKLQIDYLAVDGTTVVVSHTLSGVTTVPLTGLITAAPIQFTPAATPFTQSLPFFQNPHLFSTSATWAAGSAYQMFTSTAVNDTYVVFDWNPLLPATTGNSPGACPNCNPDLTVLMTAGQASTTDAVTYNMSNGSIMSLNGVPVYVANSPRPKKTTVQYRTYFSLNGNIYTGALTKAGTVYGGAVYQELTPGTTSSYTDVYTNKTQIRVNGPALSSMQAAFQF